MGKGVRLGQSRRVNTCSDLIKKRGILKMQDETAIHDPDAIPGPDAVPDPPDDESDIDGCSVEIEDPTADEDLPVCEGGVE
jgi:hypothetical protein